MDVKAEILQTLKDCEIDEVTALAIVAEVKKPEAFLLRLQGYSHREIGDRLGVCEMTAWRYIHRDNAGIRKMLGGC